MANKTISKFKLQLECKIDLPAGAELLSVQGHSGELWLWALVDPEAQYVTRHFVALMDGGRVPGDKNVSFIGTALVHRGALTLHVFEII